MKICIVGPGIMPIPPTGWGAVEIIIWDYKQILEKLGHEVIIVNTRDRREIVNRDHKGYATFNVSTGTSTSVQDILESVKSGIDLENEINAVYRNPDRLWDSYMDLFDGKYSLKKSIVEKETLKKSLGNNDLSKKLVDWYPESKIGDLIKSMVSLMKI